MARFNKNLLLIDGHNFLWRAHSVPFEFHSSKGTPLHVTSTFLSLLRRATQAAGGKTRFSHIAVVFDTPGATSNHLLSADYKANRVYDFEEGQSPWFHLPFIKKALKFLRVKTFEKKRVEADDVIASLATRFIAADPDHHAYITSTDSDFYQLLSPRIRQIVLGREGAVTVMDQRALAKRLGVAPHEYVYFKALVGDQADNIRGVPGIGRVRAQRIIKKKLAFDPIPHRELLDLNHKLITLNCELTLKCDWNDFALEPSGFELSSRDIFKKLRF